MIAKYDLGKKVGGKYQAKVGRDILFIERNLNFLKPDGRMAIVLPQGRFNNSSDKYIRDYIAERCRILAVVGLHGNVFKPHTGTKTSVLLVQKWDELLCPKKEDYPVFFATMQEPSKDNSGDKIYVANENGTPKLDEHGHLIVKHDLFNHEGLTEDGIAEAFIEFAKKGRVEFFSIGPSIEPFNKTRYRNLMDGLECSEVWLSYIKKSNDIFRLDSFFFAKEFLDNENLIGRIKTKSIQEIGGELRSFGAYSLNNEVEYLSEGIPFIRGVNMKNGTIDFDNLLYISDKANKLLWKSEVKPHTILLSMSGTIGDVAIAQANWKYPINSNQDIAKISFTKNVDPYFVFIFLLTKYGINYLRREARGSVQQHVFLSQIEQFKIPLLTNEFQRFIREKIYQIHALADGGQNLYLQAEQLLLDNLGMTDFTPSTERVSVKSFSESFRTSGRLDAEYYHAKYDTLFAKLSAVKTYLLGELVWIKKSLEPGSDEYRSEGIPFVRVSDLSKYGLSNPEIHLSRIPFSHMNLQPKKDTILLSKDGSVGIAYKVEKDLDIVTSGAILHLKLKTDQFLPDYLTLVLNSLIVKMQAERDAGGSIIQHWKPSEIEKVVIPWLPIDKQEQISYKIQESFSLRRESRELLERAKQAVEMAIEKDEQTAMDWLSNL